MEKHRLLRVRKCELCPGKQIYIVEHWTFLEGWIRYAFTDKYFGPTLIGFDQKEEAIEFAEQHTKEGFSFIKIC